MDAYVETDRLKLRRHTADDLDKLLDLDSDPEVMFFITGGRATTRAELERHLAHWMSYDDTPGIGFFAVEEKSSGEFLGWVHFRPGDGHADDEPELGYRLRRSAWGKGYATEASLAVIDKGFAEHAVQRVLAEAMVVNTASRRVMEKCGLSLVRVFHAEWPDRIPGDEHGDVEYALDRDEWERQRGAAQGASRTKADAGS